MRVLLGSYCFRLRKLLLRTLSLDRSLYTTKDSVKEGETDKNIVGHVAGVLFRRHPVAWLILPTIRQIHTWVASAGYAATSLSFTSSILSQPGERWRESGGGSWRMVGPRVEQPLSLGGKRLYQRGLAFG